MCLGVAFNPLSLRRGRLTRRNGAPGAAATLDALADLGRSIDGEAVHDVDAVALAAAMAQPFKPMVLSGAATAEQLRSNAGALRLLRRLQEEAGQEALARVLDVGRVAPDVYWSERSALAWN